MKTDRKIYFILSFHFGVSVLRWCLFVHLFDTPFKIYPTAMLRKGSKYLRLPDFFSFTAAFILFGTNALANN